jgi:hypothetical protein
MSEAAATLRYFEHIANQSTTDLPSWIEQAAAERLAKIGGIDRLLSCTGS